MSNVLKIRKHKRKRKTSGNSDDDEEPKKLVSKKAKTSTTTLNIKPAWSDDQLLSDLQNIPRDVSQNLIKLFNDGNTIPFIARYRKNMTNSMSADRLRNIRDTHKELESLKSRISTIIKSLHKTGVLNENIHKTIVNATSLEEVEFMYTPFKPGGKKTLAQRAKDCGLEDVSLQILNTQTFPNLKQLVRKDIKDLASLEDIENGVVYFLSHAISVDTEILTFAKSLKNRTRFLLVTKKIVSKKNDNKTQQENLDKFDIYDNYKIPVAYIKPHQVLAINRGEHLKILSVKIVIPEHVFVDFSRLCTRKYELHNGRGSRERIINRAVEDCYNRHVTPLIARDIRNDLNLKAEQASVEVFSQNLRQLLLTHPLKGVKILGVDPGFRHGCKLALINEMGRVLSTNTIYPHKTRNSNTTRDADILKSMLIEYNCDVIALGNGTAVRETENFLSDLIVKCHFAPLDVKYVIVNEDGASIYSCSNLAKEEFGDLDPNLISAVSLARRLQEPLAEYVKVEPKHLGVGMYQHDLKKKQLNEALEDVVSECVSFVGVDINTASQCLLKYIAGLSDKRSERIIAHREENGPFIQRKEILDVPGIGKRTYEQCAGFLKIQPETALVASRKSRKSYSKLDSTIIHPNMYQTAREIIGKLNLEEGDIGEPLFIAKIKEIGSCKADFEGDPQDVDLIIDALSRPIDYDMRVDGRQPPLFRHHSTTIEDLKIGDFLTGSVVNVTHFGCFVDAGIGRNVLVHISNYNQVHPKIGDKLKVRVIKIELHKKRIALEIVQLL